VGRWLGHLYEGALRPLTWATACSLTATAHKLPHCITQQHSIPLLPWRTWTGTYMHCCPSPHSCSCYEPMEPTGEAVVTCNTCGNHAHTVRALLLQRHDAGPNQFQNCMSQQSHNCRSDSLYSIQQCHVWVFTVSLHSTRPSNNPCHPATYCVPQGCFGRWSNSKRTIGAQVTCVWCRSVWSNASAGRSGRLCVCSRAC
jgi:hypothetical protein